MTANRKNALFHLRQILLQRRDALRRALNGDLSMLRELNKAQGSGREFGDVAADSTGNEISMQLAEVEAKELEKVSEALQRFQEGTYGVCTGCGINIPIARLQALPFAALCIKCQTQAERQNSGQLQDDWTKLAGLPSDNGDSQTLVITVVE